MQKHVAEKICRELLRCSGKLDKSVAVLEGAGDQKLFERHRVAVGQIMGLFYVDILRDLFRQYPDLEPDSMKRGET